MTTIRVNVTKKVIEESRFCGNELIAQDWEAKNKINGLDGYMSNCAIAKAIWDIIPNICVLTQEVMFYSKTSCLGVSDLPKKAVRFVDKFDRSSPAERLSLEPISFELEIPDTVIDNISIEEITKRLELQVEKTVELV